MPGGYCALGTYMELFGDFKENLDKLLAGEPVEPIIQDDPAYGWMMTAMTPVLHEDGTMAAYVMTDISMQDVMNTRRDFVVGLAVLLLGLTIGFIALFLVFLRRKVVRPIKLLTDATGAFIQNNEAELAQGSAVVNVPEIRTGDEVEELADAFREMERDMISYIKSFAEVTAEKERIGAELNVATQIQADMLPRMFPAFPERKEFDIYGGLRAIVSAMPEDMLRGDEEFQQRVVGEASSVANRELGELAADKPNARWGEISTAAFRGSGGNMVQPVMQTMFRRMMGEENIKNAFEADDPDESINQVGKLARDSGVVDLLRQSQEQSFEGLNFEGLSEEGKSHMTMQNFYTRAVSAIAANKDKEKAKAAQRRLNMQAGTGQFIDEQDASIMGWTSGAGRELMNSLAETPAPAQPAALEVPSLPSISLPSISLPSISLPSISLAEGPKIGPMPPPDPPCGRTCPPLPLRPSWSLPRPAGRRAASWTSSNSGNPGGKKK